MESGLLGSTAAFRASKNTERFGGENRPLREGDLHLIIYSCSVVQLAVVQLGVGSWQFAVIQFAVVQFAVVQLGVVGQ